jgi:hypothetical protein
MARPPKPGLDYFPLDVSFDDAVDLIEAEHGLEGFAILIKIWQKIYSNGYYTEWTDDTELLFSKKINSDKNKVSSVINSCLLRNLLDKFMYEKYKVLTSAGIQKRYLTACVASKRKNIVFEEKFLLLEDKYKSLITELIEFTPEETPVNSGESTQRKGKERKGNNNDIYIKCQHLSMNKKDYDKLVTEYGEQSVKSKIEYASNYAKLKNYKSLYLTLNNWLKSDKGKGGTNSGGTSSNNGTNEEFDFSKIITVGGN